MRGKSKTVGELNGPWAWAFRIMHMGFPIFAGACLYLCWTLPGELSALREWRKASESKFLVCDAMTADMAAIKSWRDTIVPERDRLNKAVADAIAELRAKGDEARNEIREQVDRLEDKIDTKANALEMKIDTKSAQTQAKLDHLLELITKPKE